MRKTHQEAKVAFTSENSGSFGNLMVSNFNQETKLFLFGNEILKKDASGQVWVSTAGWQTKTTISVLNSFGLNVGVKNRKLLLNNKPWNGQWEKVQLP